MTVDDVKLRRVIVQLEDTLKKVQAQRDLAQKERDLARKELDDLAVEVGYGEYPEGQGHVIRMSGPELAKQWMSERRELEVLREEIDEATDPESGLECAKCGASSTCFNCDPSRSKA